MMGKDSKTGKITTLTKINGLALYNNGDFLIQFGPSNSVALTAILAQGALSGPYLPGNNIIDNSIRMSDSLSQNPSIPPSLLLLLLRLRLKILQILPAFHSLSQI